MPEPVVGYSIRVEYKEVPVRVYINDWLVADRRGMGGNESVLLNPFIVKGKNVLRVLLGPIDEPRSQWADLELSRQEPGSETKTRIYSARWRPSVVYSRSEWWTMASHELHVREAFGPWKWEEATPFLLQDEPAARDRVALLHETLRIKDVDAFIAMSGVKIEELARATGRPAVAVTEVQRGLIKSFLEEGELLPLDRDDLVFLSGAGGRLVLVRTQKGDDPLLMRVGSDGVSLPVVLSNLASGFELVR